MSSLPVPVSPRMSTGQGLSAILRTSEMTSFMAGLSAMIRSGKGPSSTASFTTATSSSTLISRSISLILFRSTGRSTGFSRNSSAPSFRTVTAVCTSP